MPSRFESTSVLEGGYGVIVTVKKPKQRGSLLGLFDKLLLGFIWVVIGSLIAESLYIKGFQRFNNRLRVPYGSPKNGIYAKNHCINAVFLYICIIFYLNSRFILRFGAEIGAEIGAIYGELILEFSAFVQQIFIRQISIRIPKRSKRMSYEFISCRVSNSAFF